MNKTQKRQLNIRNKLFAAIAMLLVSSIMMVSTTYAWFTLSTAPEVQGITTTVGSNGNLEIALSPANGSADGITSAMGDSNAAWVQKNLTWGNLLNLSDSSYKLSEIKLLPARLNGTVGGTIAVSPLKTPVYGADGRISVLDANTSVGAYDGDKQGFVVGSTYGVRAVGTSSSMTPQQLTYYNSLSKLATSMSNAQDKAEASMNANGAKLAEMAVNHANAGADDNASYAEYLPTLRAVITALGEANNEIEQGIRAAMMAAAASGQSNEEAYTWAVPAISDSNNSLETLWSELMSKVSSAAVMQSDLKNSYDKWAAIKADLSAAMTALETAETKSKTETVLWSDVSAVMTKIMNVDSGISINDKNLTDFKELAMAGISESKPTGTQNDGTEWTDQEWEEAKRFVGQLTSGVTLQLGNGSGVYADIGAVAGDLTARVEIASLKYGNLSLPYVKATIKTVSEPTDGAYLQQANAELQLAGTMTGGTASNVIDVTYGYIVDFMFRTNAANSNLLLQTAAAQRVYDSSESTATLGGGSTMTFATGALDDVAVKGLMECVRVVFIDTASNTILGIAKLDMTGVTTEDVTDTDGNVTATNITAPLYLHSVTTNEQGVLTFGAKLTDGDATLCALPTNTAKAVSAMVYLDGDNVDNADVANGTDSMTGTLNLQFASSADLVPMSNSGLENMQETSYKLSVKKDSANTEPVTLSENGALLPNSTFSYNASTLKAGIESVTATMGGTTVENVYDAETGMITIPNVTGDVVITINVKETTVTMNVTGGTTDPAATSVYVAAGDDYSFTVTPTVAGSAIVVQYRMGGAATAVTITPNGDGLYTVPDIAGAVEVTVTCTAPVQGT